MSFFQKEADLKLVFSEFLIKTSITLYTKNMTQNQIEAVFSLIRVYTVVGGGRDNSGCVLLYSALKIFEISTLSTSLLIVFMK